MRKKQFLVLVLTFAFLSVSGIGLISLGSSATAAKPLVYEPMDIGSKFRDIEVDTSMDLKFKESSSSSGAESSEGLGIYKTWLWNDDVTGLYTATYELYAVGAECELWVMTDLSWGNPEDPRPIPVITIDQANYMVDQFDNVIYPTDTGYFGDEDAHDGSNNALGPPGYFYDLEGKTVILVSNIGDENYYDYTYPSYIAGFYWGSVFEYYCDRNVMSIDAYDWERRTGPQDPPVEGSRPYLYESVFAHEFQHLIHDDIFSGDETYMNEACSLYAEPLCGYPTDYGQIEWFLATPDNSLTEWGDQGGINILADYGAAFLWAVYLEEHYGPNFLSEYVQGTGLPKSSIERISALLALDGKDFFSVFHDWRIANLLDGRVSDELYNYETLNLDDLDPLRIYEISKKKFGWAKGQNFGRTYTQGTLYMPDGYRTDAVELGPFSSDYIALTGLEDDNYIYFNGDDVADYDYKWKYLKGYDASPTGNAWYSRDGDLINILLAGEAWVDPEDPTLSLTTYWFIEDNWPESFEGWDYGFIQVSTDDGETWTSLSNSYTENPPVESCLGKIVDTLPGLTGWTGDYTYEPYITMDFDLSDYEDQDIMIGFRYMTDWGTTLDGWYIYDASVSGATVGLENVPIEADFMVTVVKTDGVDYEIYDLLTSDIEEFGAFFDYIANDEDIILIISPIMEYGTVDYRFRNMEPKML